MSTPDALRTVAENLAAATRDRRKKTIPEPAVLAEYAAQLPPVYRQVLAAFLDTNPGRMAGEDVAAVSIQMHLRNTGVRYDLPDIVDACLALVAAGFLDDTSRAFESFAPTPVGEALIAVITGREAPSRTIPALPSPTW
jgi:hypothetical protein